jgi:uncharacterized membrane protein YccF (DUF307 family)
MTTLEWILIGVIAVLLIILVPLIMFVIGSVAFWSSILPKNSKSLWQTIVDKLRQFVGHS